MTETSVAARGVLPPGPVGDPLTEIVPQLVSDPFGSQWRWWQEFGDIWTVPLPSGPFVFLAEPELVRQLLTNHLDHGAMVRATIPAQGKGITVQHGSEWRRSRVLMNPMFSRPQLRHLVGRMVEAIGGRLHHLDARAGTGEVFDMAKFLGEVTIRVLFHTMFSDEFSDHEIDHAVKQLDVISVYKGELMTSAWRPPGTPIVHEADGASAVAALDELLYDSIRRRRARGAEDQDLLDRLIGARDDDGHGFSDEEIRDQLTVLFFGGYETTQWALAWALAFLAEVPAVRLRLLDEIDTLNGRLPTADDLGTLEYARATVSEALRHQGTLVLPRQLETDDTFAGYTIPAGTLVGASTMVIHHRPDLWDEPQQFRPERFLELDGNAQHRYLMLSFGGGPRVCLGINLAYFEAQLTLALFLSRYEYALAPGWSRRGVHQYSMVLEGGLPISISRRAGRS
jgi:cytochrome P450